VAVEKGALGWLSKADESFWLNMSKIVGHQEKNLEMPDNIRIVLLKITSCKFT